MQSFKVPVDVRKASHFVGDISHELTAVTVQMRKLTVYAVSRLQAAIQSLHAVALLLLSVIDPRTCPKNGTFKR